MNYKCPVRGFDELPFLLADNNTCSCCGTEFGYHDLRLSHTVLRNQSVANGSHWFSARMPPPTGWNVAQQIRNMPAGREVPSKAF